MRTGDLRESFRVVQSAGKIEVGTDIYYARIHQQGGPIDAEYKTRGKAGISATFKLPTLSHLKPGASSAAKLAQSAFRRQRRKAARKVKLPARKFLGVSKRDRKRTTKILIDKLSEAMKLMLKWVNGRLHRGTSPRGRRSSAASAAWRSGHGTACLLAIGGRSAARQAATA